LTTKTRRLGLSVLAVSHLSLTFEICKKHYKNVGRSLCVDVSRPIPIFPYKHTEAYMSADTADVRTPPRRIVLSKNEEEILQLKCLELSSVGNSIRECADKLGVSMHVVRKALDGVKSEMRDALLSNLVAERVPLAVAQTLELQRIIIKKSLEIESSSHDPRVKLEALRLCNTISQNTNQLLSEARTIASAIQRSLLVVNQSARPIELTSNDSNDDDSNVDDDSDNDIVDNDDGIDESIPSVEEESKV
jgi:predicted DNA-binding protein (UPF0251 family)